jgi:hypothetical protein
MVTAAQDYACFTNDLHSYQKEIQFEGELHNMVLVMQRFLDVDRWTAADIVARLMRERMEQFEMLVETGLPKLFKEYDLSGPGVAPAYAPVHRRRTAPDPLRVHPATDRPRHRRHQVAARGGGV